MKVTPDRLDVEPEADDPRLFPVVQQYLAELEAGRRPDRGELAARFPDLADALGPYLDALDVMHDASSRVHQADSQPLPAATDEVKALGDFRIVRELGRGGMGIVYEAVQLSLGRRVALKVLPFAAALDSRQLQRFKNEAQAAAQLHHSNIVPVYYVGCERGVHFYAMQLIEGHNLAVLIDDMQRGTALPAASAVRLGLADQPTGPYPPPPAPLPGLVRDTRPGFGAQLTTQRSNRSADFFRTAARLAAQAAEGLDYAHGLGIVHRDIKPANLLVDDRGNIWITDFGLAQFHADAGLTHTGDLVGTLRYMSPEQAGGQRVVLDHRTDVYSLGATLYELLTLRLIFEGNDRNALLCQIACDEPRLPRSIDRTIPPELETIVLKAVSKSPAERYATARDFADDLHRFLRYEPIRARRATPLQRARKWLRRHPSVSVAAVVLLVMLTAGSLVSAWLIRSEQEKTLQRAEEAEARFRLAKQSVDEVIHISEEELVDKPQLEALRKRLLESAVVYYQKFIDQRRDVPAAQEELREEKARVEKLLADLAVLQGDRLLRLLSHPAVLDDLELTGQQRTRVLELLDRIAKRRMESFPNFGRLSPEDRQQRFLALARENDAEVRQLLSEKQRRRLRQIALQAQGPMAFRDPDVVAALKLTPEQKTSIRTIEADVLFSRPDRHRPGPPPGEGPPPGGRPPPGGPQRGVGPPRKPHDQNLKAALEQMLALLSEEQVKRWQELTGDPFKGSILLLLTGPAGSFGPR